jgi:DNA-binding CsgD family transcriptional regulator
MPTTSHLPEEQLPPVLVGDDPINLVSLVELLLKVLDEIDTGVLVCDERAAVKKANWSARRELAEGGLLRTSAGVLTAAGSNARLYAAVGAACHGGKRAVLALTGGDQRLHVSISPIFAQDGEPLALVMLGRRAPCSPAALELLGIQQGLTATERKVLAGLAAQRSPAQIADDHCVALSTVRTHIAALRAKLGVRSQQALVCVAYAIPPLAPALRSTPFPQAAPQRALALSSMAAA